MTVISGVIAPATRANPMTEILMPTLGVLRLPEARGLLSSMLISELACPESSLELLAKL